MTAMLSWIASTKLNNVSKKGRIIPVRSLLSCHDNFLLRANYSHPHARDKIYDKILYKSHLYRTNTACHNLVMEGCKPLKNSVFISV